MNRIELSDDEWGRLRVVFVHSYRLTRPMQTVYWRLPVDITFGGAVTGFAANVRQMEHHLQTFLALVREWGLGETARIFFRSR